jgi:hypothetical protein
MTEALRKLLAASRAPRDIAWLAAFRVLFGLIMLVSMLRYVAFEWVEAFFIAPRFHFKYWGFAWVEPLPGPLMHGLVWALAALALCIALGFCFRFAAWAFAIGFAYLQLIDAATYLNHYYLAGLLAFLLALSPAHRAYSVDARLRPELARNSVASGWHYMLRFQLGVVYTFAGLAKLTSDWLVHHQPLKIWLSSHTDMPLLGVLFRQPCSAPAMSWAGFLFDTTIALFLSNARSRPYAYVVVIGFHAVTSALFPIGMFPVIMIAGALLFFGPSWPRALAGVLTRFRVPKLVGFARPPQLTTPLPAARHHHFALLALALVYCALHVALPLRYLAYDGNVHWHEQGMRFSWRVMVREKNGSIAFHARDPQTGQAWVIAPRRYLARWQEKEMWGQPDLILQLAHHVQRQLELEHGRAIELRVDARVSLNGRRSRPLIDPEVDVAAFRDGLAQAAWITASPAEPPPKLRPVMRQTAPSAVPPAVRRALFSRKNAVSPEPTSG